jgi:threonylcarbamoyladenosine tRNA methylthiotransferase MtaB
MPGHLPPPVKRARLERLLEVGRESAQAFRRRFLGRSVEVLWEQRRAGYWQGLTANYIRVYTSADDGLANRLLPVRLLAPHGEGVLAALEGTAVMSTLSA